MNNQKKIPRPKLLEERLINFFDKYNQQKFNIISENLLKQHRENLVHVRLGCISDIENKPSEIIISKCLITNFIIINKNNLIIINILKFLNSDPTGNKIKSLCLRGTSSLEQANKAFATPFRRTACGPRMANALLKITVFRRNIRMGKLNRQDKILLQCNNS